MRKVEVEERRSAAQQSHHLPAPGAGSGLLARHAAHPAVSDEAIKADVEWTLKLGFNGARKHQKIEDPRYYYWADKLGMLVWSGGALTV
jgi:hypothetical protein